jgi:hypothetical protein
MSRCTDPAFCPDCAGVGSRVYSAPIVKTTNTFLAKNGQLGGDQFRNPAVREFMLQRAREAGVSTDGKFYEPRIADSPGDPRAWIEGPDDVRRVAEERNLTITGDVKVKGEAVAPAPDVPIADDIVESLVEDRLEKEYGPEFTEVSGAPVERAKEDVMNTHAPPAHWAKP